MEKCVEADAIIIGSPVYFSYPTGVFRNFIERLMFANHTYVVDKEKGGCKTQLNRTISVGVIYTMNCPEDLAHKINYDIILEENTKCLNHVLGYAESLYAYDTYQFVDYSKYNVDLFDEKEKAKVRDEQFPKDLEKAFDLGKRLVEKQV